MCQNRQQVSRDHERRRGITVVLVDDEPLVRKALSDVLSSGGFDLIGEAPSGEAAIEIVVELCPAVVLLDLRLPGISGLETIERLSLLAPSSRVLVLTRSEQNLVVEAIVAARAGTS